MKKTARLLSIVIALMLVLSFIPGAGLRVRAEGDTSGDATGDATVGDDNGTSTEPVTGDTWTFTVEPTTMSLKVGEEQGVTLTAKKNGTTVTDDSITITPSSNDTSKATATTEKITAVAEGTAKITYTLKEGDTVKGTAEVSVTVTPAQSSSDKITITPKRSDDTLWVGAPEKISDLFTIENPDKVNIKWSVSDNGIAALDSDKITPKTSHKQVVLTAKDADGKELYSEKWNVDQYHCIESNPAGPTPKWKKGSKSDLEFRVGCYFKDNDEDAFENFREVIGDSKTPALKKGTDYTISEGSVWVELKPEYLETLSLGKHYIEVVFNIDGEGSVATEKIYFYVADSSGNIPGTKDATLIGLGVFLFLLSLTYVALFTYDKKTRKFRRRAYATSGRGNNYRRSSYNRSRSSRDSRSRRRYY